MSVFTFLLNTALKLDQTNPKLEKVSETSPLCLWTKKISELGCLVEWPPAVAVM